MVLEARGIGSLTLIDSLKKGLVCYQVALLHFPVDKMAFPEQGQVNRAKSLAVLKKQQSL